jgi:predicted nucleotide-binding protein (sugar kinase/HSP70/actin superfamily)
MVKAALSAAMVTPEVDLSGGEETFVAGVAPALVGLGVSRSEVIRAFREAASAWAEFRSQILDAGQEVIAGANRVLVVIGKPYNVLDPYLNLNLFQHLRRLGVVAIPMWALPFEEVVLDPQANRLPWHLNRAILRAVQYCDRDPRFYPVVISNFGCGPDAFTQMHLEQILDGRPALMLEFDEHRAEAGLVTRLEAFLDKIDQPRCAEAPKVVAPAGNREAVASPSPGRARESFLVPYFSDHAFVFSGALKARGHSSRVLPLPNEKIRLLGETHTSGKECHP